MHPRLKAAALFALGILVMGALVAYVGPAGVAEAFARASPAWLALAFLSYSVFFVLRGVRWRALLASGDADVRLGSTTSITAVGWLANSVLPFKGGDLLRAALLARREKIALGRSASTVALERVLDLLGLALLAAVGLLILPRTATLPEGLERALAVAWLLPLVALALIVVLVRFRAPTVRFMGRLLRPLGKLGERLVAFGDSVLVGLHVLGRAPRALLVLLPLTILVAITQALVFTCLVSAFLAGTPLALAFAGSTLFLLSFVISITPGNVGTYEAAFVAVFVALGASTESAVVAAILTHLTTTLTVAVLGSVGLVALGMAGPAAWKARTTPKGVSE